MIYSGEFPPMRREYKGEVTTFLSLILSILLIFILSLYESALYSYELNHIENTLFLAGNSLLSEYNISLFNKYSLFAIDTSYKGNEAGEDKLASHAKLYIEENMIASKSDSFYVQEVAINQVKYAKDDEYAAIFEQIKGIMNRPSDTAIGEVDVPQDNDTIEQVADKHESGITGDEMQQLTYDISRADRFLNRLKEMWNEDLRIIEEYDDDLDNPAKGIYEFAENGEEYLISEYCPGRGNHIQSESSYAEEMPYNSGFAIDGGSDTKWVEEAEILADYICQKCTNETNSNSASYCLYESEYIICGKSDDYENLKELVYRILEVIAYRNYQYLTTDSSAVYEIHTTAQTIIEDTAAAACENSVEESFVCALSYIEAYLEVKALLEGKKTDYFDVYSSFCIPIADIGDYGSYMSNVNSYSENGLSYEDFIRAYLSMQDISMTLSRFADIASMNVRNADNSCFSLKDSIVGFDITGEITMIGWKNKGFARSCKYR